jgi:hypothetical protein
MKQYTKVLPKDQLQLDTQVIRRITLGFAFLDNKGAKGDNFMDFYYMNKYYAKHMYQRDSSTKKLAARVVIGSGDRNISKYILKKAL